MRLLFCLERPSLRSGWVDRESCREKREAKSWGPELGERRSLAGVASGLFRRLLRVVPPSTGTESTSPFTPLLSTACLLLKSFRSAQGRSDDWVHYPPTRHWFVVSCPSPRTLPRHQSLLSWRKTTPNAARGPGRSLIRFTNHQRPASRHLTPPLLLASMDVTTTPSASRSHGKLIYCSFTQASAVWGSVSLCPQARWPRTSAKQKLQVDKLHRHRAAQNPTGSSRADCMICPERRSRSPWNCFLFALPQPCFFSSPSPSLRQIAMAPVRLNRETTQSSVTDSEFSSINGYEKGSHMEKENAVLPSTIVEDDENEDNVGHAAYLRSKEVAEIVSVLSNAPLVLADPARRSLDTRAEQGDLAQDRSAAPPSVRPRSFSSRRKLAANDIMHSFLITQTLQYRTIKIAARPPLANPFPSSQSTRRPLTMRRSSVRTTSAAHQQFKANPAASQVWRTPPTSPATSSAWWPPSSTSGTSSLKSLLFTFSVDTRLVASLGSRR